MVSNEVRWHPEALQDAEAARDWYAERSPFAARGFLLALEDALNSVEEAPKRSPSNPLVAGTTYFHPIILSRSFIA